MTAAQKCSPQQVKLLEGRAGDYVNEHLNVFYSSFVGDYCIGVLCEFSYCIHVKVELLELVSPSREDRCLSPDS